MIAENIVFQELNGDQAREAINARQRYDAYGAARKRLDGYRGSMLFAARAGSDYLLRDFYDPVSGVKKQRSLGKRNPVAEATLIAFERGKAAATEAFKEAQDALRRQAGVNRALALGRVPDIGARIIRALDDAGLLGHGVRVVGTNALFAYEAAAGVRLGSEVTTTEDIDILFDARAKLRFVADQGFPDRTLIGLLKKIDKTFEKAEADFQARNASGYLVDLIRPQRSVPWAAEKDSLSNDPSDLIAVQIEGLAWHESAPAFQSVAIDTKGFPVRLVAPDPRAFAVHKLWLSKRSNRSPLKRRRDEAQARLVAALTTQYLTHLPFDGDVLRSFPRQHVEDAAALFAVSGEKHDL